MAKKTSHPKQPKIFVRTLDYRTGKVEVEIEGVRKYTVNVPDFKLWSPEEPNLTTMEIDGRQVRFGIRQIEAKALRKLRHPSRSGLLVDYI